MTQVVGWRMSAARKSQGRTQEWVAERMSRFTGANWTVSTVSLAENSATSSRPRSFTANDIVALARTFGMPIPYFFIPPDDREKKPYFPDASNAGWDYLIGLLVGSDDQRRKLAVLLSNDEAILRPIRIPQSDLIEEHPDRALGNDVLSISGISLLTAALFGIYARKLDGWEVLGNGVGKTADVLKSISEAIKLIEDFPLDTFVDPQLAADFESRRSKDVETDR